MDNNTMFSQQIAHLAKGSTDMELTEALTSLVKSINDHQKKGTITLTLTLKPKVHHGEVKWISIQPKISVTEPDPDRMSSVFFPTHSGDLLRDDPEQGEMDLKEVKVDTDTGEIREL